MGPGRTIKSFTSVAVEAETITSRCSWLEASENFEYSIGLGSVVATRGIMCHRQTSHLTCGNIS